MEEDESDFGSGEEEGSEEEESGSGEEEEESGEEDESDEGSGEGLSFFQEHEMWPIWK